MNLHTPCIPLENDVTSKDFIEEWWEQKKNTAEGR